MKNHQHPFLKAIESLTGPLPHFTGKDNYPIRERLNDILSSSELTDFDYQKLHDYCSVNRRPDWATGTSMIEAADLIVASAIENGNLKTERA